MAAPTAGMLRTASQSVKLATIDKEIHRFHKLMDTLLRTDVGTRATAPPPAAAASAPAASSSSTLAPLTEGELLAAFEAEWEGEFGDEDSGYEDNAPRSWHSYRGHFGETCLHWIELMKSINKKGTPLGDLLMQLTKCLLAKKPELFSDAYDDGPFQGQTLLLQACANGDEETVDFFLQYATVEDCNAYATGTFITDKLLCHHYQEVQWHTASVLEVAAVAPTNEEVAVRLVKKLLENGANAYQCEGTLLGDLKDGGSVSEGASKKPVQRTLLHRLAVSRWRKEPSSENRFEMADGEIMEASRLRALLQIVFSPPPSAVTTKARKTDTVARFMKSEEEHLTPIQIASIVGNDVFIIEYLKNKQQVEWQWGHRRSVKMPLIELDCSHMGQTRSSVMELLVLYKHRGTLNINLFVELVGRKWEKFGLTMTIKNLVMQIVYSVLVTVGSFERMSATLFLGGRDVSRLCRRTALVMGACVTTSRLIMKWMSRNTAWTRMLAWDGTAQRLGITQVPRIVDILVFALGLVLLTLHEVELQLDTKHHDLLIFLDSLSAVFIFVAWFSLLRFLKLFKETCVLISVLPVIVMRDMPPWMAVWVVMCIGTAGAIRTSLWHNVQSSDEVIGTFWKTAMTLEEATHGPDVQWRYIVMNQPVMAAIFFLIFLWLVTIIMMNLLITIFSATFETRKSRAFSELVYWRAVAVISCEKALPISFHNYMGYRLGIDLDEIETHSASSHSGEATPLLPRRSQVNGGMRWMDINECVGYDEWASQCVKQI